MPLYLGKQIGALIEPLTGRRWEPDAIRARLETRAALFEHMGLRRGGRVLLLTGNSLEFFVDLLALWQFGACAIPIDARLTPFEVDVLAAATRPHLAVVAPDTSDSLVRSLSAAGVKLAGDETLNLPAVHSRAAPALDDPALILFTSGTTGDPKGVVHTHRTLRAKWSGLNEALGTAPYARTLCLLPTHFGHGLICNSLFVWLNGGDLYILPPFRADVVTTLGALIDAHGITAMSSVPSLWSLALRLAKPPRGGTLARVHCGSAPFSTSMWQEVQRWSGTRQVINTYGITETASWIAGTNFAEITPQDGLIGRPWGAEIKIIATGEGPHAEPCAPGEPGMIWLKTPALMTGYFERDDLTHKAVRKGWYATGDIGFVDERGHLYLRGRERDEINKGGMKVHPSDIDSLALQSANVIDACAFAIDSDLYGQDVSIAVVLAPAETGALEELKSFMGARLAKHQMPVQWHVVDAIPRSSRGKINRLEVAAMCAAHKADT